MDANATNPHFVYKDWCSVKEWEHPQNVAQK